MTRCQLLTATALAALAALVAPAGAGAQVYLMPQRPAAAPAWIEVTLPDPGARVWFDGTPTRQRGMARTFVTPPLPTGKSYTYTVKASWQDNGREVTRTRKAQVRPGRMATVRFFEAVRQAGPGGGEEAAESGTDNALPVSRLQEMATARGYLKAHQGVDKPLALLGGPVTVHVTQKAGGVHVALPDHRKLDPRVFGPRDMPRAYTGTPVITGVPPALRESRGQGPAVLKEPSPFGDKYLVLGNGKLELEATDATATDAAKSDDAVKFKASWKDDEGNTYSVTCNQVVPHGVEYPVFGGVVTNHILHGFSRLGTPLMPTEFAYVAFWGIGTVSKNGKVIDDKRIVHGMLTEYVRKEDYKLGFDHEVTPTRRQFHLMVPPVKAEGDHFAKQPVKTGFTPPDGKELPFWHVMFANLEINAERAGGEKATPAASPEKSREGTKAAGKDEPAKKPAAVVKMTNQLAFVPEKVTVRAGDTVEWKNPSKLVHTVTADPDKALDKSDVQLPEGAKPFNSGKIQPGGTYRHTFTVPGHYKYFCIPHERTGMIAEVEVEPASSK